jgi:U3 small nucleolar RNA-associated protein 15
MEELSHRNSLVVALAGRDSTALAPLLMFLLAHVVNPRYSSFLVDVAELILGMCHDDDDTSCSRPLPLCD